MRKFKITISQDRASWRQFTVKISTVIALLPLVGCFNLSSGAQRNRCNDPPPPFDSQKIVPGMYLVQGSDTTALPLTVQVFHSNGIRYTRSNDRYPNGTPIAEETWHTYIDSGEVIKWGGSGEVRGTMINGQWSQVWSAHGGFSQFYKSDITANSFRRLTKREVRDFDGSVIDCVWDSYTFVRIGGEQAPWPSLVGWLEVWPNSVRRN